MSSRNSVGVHSIAYGPSGRGVVTDRATCHQAPRAAGSKNAFSTRPDGAAMTAVTSRLGVGGIAKLGIWNLEVRIRDHEFQIPDSQILNYCAGAVVRGCCVRARVTISLTSRINVGTWYGIPSLIVHSIPPPCAACTRSFGPIAE